MPCLRAASIGKIRVNLRWLLIYSYSLELGSPEKIPRTNRFQITMLYFLT